MQQITKQKIEKYLGITEKALESVKTSSKGGGLVLDMAQRYFSDAKHYYMKKDFVTAFAAVNYAHGWLDAGARLGAIKVNKNRELFTID